MSLIGALVEELAGEYRLSVDEVPLVVSLRYQHVQEMLVEDVAQLIEELTAWGDTEVQVLVVLGVHVGAFPQYVGPALRPSHHKEQPANQWLALVAGAVHNEPYLQE